MARVLIIDDNATNLDLMVYLLHAFGHTPVGVSNAVHGLREMRKGYDVVLSDIRMPQMNGYQLIQRIRGDTELKDAVVVAITALAMSGDRDRILSAGFDGYISKPIDPQRFVAEVESFLAIERGTPR